MTAQERRNAILSHLQRGKSPLSATALAGLLGVSRQVIVGDVALLRAGGVQIVSTSRGYLIPPEEGLVRQVVCQHTPHQTQEELYAMVDGGCTVLDVTVEHPVYGQLTGRSPAALLPLRCGRIRAQNAGKRRPAPEPFNRRHPCPSALGPR